MKSIREWKRARRGIRKSKASQVEEGLEFAFDAIQDNADDIMEIKDYLDDTDAELDDHLERIEQLESALEEIYSFIQQCLEDDDEEDKEDEEDEQVPDQHKDENFRDMYFRLDDDTENDQESECPVADPERNGHHRRRTKIRSDGMIQEYPPVSEELETKSEELVTKPKDPTPKEGGIVIQCNQATMNRILRMADESDYCIFSDSICTPYRTPSNLPICRECCSNRIHWIITDKADAQ